MISKIVVNAQQALNSVLMVWHLC